MQAFKIKEEGIKQIRKRALIRSIPVMVIALTTGIVMSSINSGDKAGDVNVLPFVIPVIAIAAGYGIYRGLQRKKELLESYTLTFSDNLITRYQLNTPTISVYFNDITEITRHANGSFTIIGKNKSDLIEVPFQIDSSTEVETLLQNIRPIQSKEKTSVLQKYQGFAGLISVGLMVCVYTVKNKIVVASAGSLFIGFMIWSLIMIQKSKNVDKKTKNNLWWVLLVLLSVIGAMIAKLKN